MNDDSEVTEDAVSALRLAAALPQVDSTRMFVLGHSLGGMLVPRIVQRAGAGRVAGGIVLAGPARTMRELLTEQLTYLASVKGVSETDVSAQVDGMMASLPESYREMDNSYRPLEAAAALEIPLLFLPGERDYQVTMQDFGLWRSALAVKAQI